MKEWFEKNDEMITKWMDRAIITVFAANSICDIISKNASGALGWACACLWCFMANKWHELAVMDDKLLTMVLDKIRKSMQDEKEEEKQ